MVESGRDKLTVAFRLTAVDIVDMAKKMLELGLIENWSSNSTSSRARTPSTCFARFNSETVDSWSDMELQAVRVIVLLENIDSVLGFGLKRYFVSQVVSSLVR